MKASEEQIDHSNQYHQPYPSQNNAFLSHNNNQPFDKWTLDSGATQHMCNNKSLFINLIIFNRDPSNIHTIAKTNKIKTANCHGKLLLSIYSITGSNKTIQIMLRFRASEKTVSYI